MWPFKRRNQKSDISVESNLGSFSLKSLPDAPTAKILPHNSSFGWNSLWGTDHAFRIKLYRFLRDSVPVLNSAIWTWARLCSSPSFVQIKGSDEPAIVNQAGTVITDLDGRFYRPTGQSGWGMDAFVSQFFNSLFTDGMVCGEIALTPSGDKVDRFYFIDPASLRFELKPGQNWEIFQAQEGRRVRLNPHSTFYFGLDTDVNSPLGKSLLASVPFVARIEQQLVSDMHKTMHNSGYHRLHVQIKPPVKSALESEDAYVNRANRYFNQTANLMKDFSPEDNPITWSDVEIKYIGPESRQAAAMAWYVNHKAMIEDIASGMHLDPFMLGYSYGTTQTWAGFKLEIIQRNVVSLQRIAQRCLDWVRNIELALQGLPVTSQHYFDNHRGVGNPEQRQAEKTALENIIRKQKEGYISFEDAKKQAQNV